MTDTTQHQSTPLPDLDRPIPVSSQLYEAKMFNSATRLESFSQDEKIDLH